MAPTLVKPEIDAESEVHVKREVCKRSDAVMKPKSFERERGIAAAGPDAASAARLALRIYSLSRLGEATSLLPPSSKLTDFREEFPGKLRAVLETLKSIIDKVDTTVDNYVDELKELRDRCIYVTACVSVKCRRHGRCSESSFASGGVNLRPLVECLREVNVLAERCGGRRGRFWKALRASATERSIAELHRCIEALTRWMGLDGIVIVQNKVDNLLPLLVSPLHRV